MNGGCSHLDRAGDVTPSSGGCEDWWYCYVDDLTFVVDGAPSFAHP
jgi:hypothetical protein